MPSIREVALNIKVNPNTVVKAYSLLENEKYIESIPKKGYVVIFHKNSSKLDNLRIEIDRLHELGFTNEEIKKVIQEEKKK